jgi:signal transduction histidine kinase
MKVLDKSQKKCCKIRTYDPSRVAAEAIKVKLYLRSFITTSPHPRVSQSIMNVSPLNLKRSLHTIRELREPPTVALLLKLEWMLLGFTSFTVPLMASIVARPEFVSFTLLSVAVLSLMQLKRPITRISKICHTVLELLVLTFPSFIESGLPFFPLLGLVIVMRSCERFELPGRLIVSGLTFAVFALKQLLSQGSIPEILIKSSEQANRSALQSLDVSVLMLKLNAALSFGLALFFVLLLINALLEERQSRAKLVEALNQLRQYSLRIEDQSALQERNRIAREIHDSLGHTLTAQSIQIDSALLLQHSNSEESRFFLKEAKQLCKQALQEVRQSVATLRTDPRQGKSLDNMATNLIREFRVTTAIEPTYVIRLSHPIPAEAVSALYRVLQEALTNITRHSRATNVLLQLFTEDRTLHLYVHDNGKGFDPDQNSTGFGLQGMRERIIALGGQFKLSSQIGEGCRISVKVPLAVRLLA